MSSVSKGSTTHDAVDFCVDGLALELGAKDRPINSPIEVVLENIKISHYLGST